MNRGRYGKLAPGAARRALAAFGAIGFVALVAGASPSAAQQGPTDDPGSGLEWHLATIGAPTAWARATGTGATIAIVDTGVDLAHEDLQGGKIARAVTCLDTGGNTSGCVDGGQDDNGHGTHVAGIAAANGDNAIGVVGVAPEATILAVKVLRQVCSGLPGGGCEASGTAADVEAGIRWATDNGATVINLSLGSTTQSVFGPSFADAVEYAWEHGVIPVVAAGNDFVLSSGFSGQHAIVVDAVNRAGTKSSYSNGVGAASWALAAPGGESDTASSCKSAPQGILSTYWRAGESSSYACLAGTSMAAPQVAGAAAVLRSAGLSAPETVQRLLGTARDIGAVGPDSTYGAGLVDLAAAISGIATPTSATSPVGQEPTTAPPVTDEAPSTEPAPPEASTTTIPPVVELPSTTVPSDASEVAAPVALRTPHDDLPPGPVTAAVLLVGGIGASSGWMLVRGAGWARRTPG
ncbi:MAG: S8 family serine peptidase [Acidimicrobiales bacterium]